MANAPKVLIIEDEGLIAANLEMILEDAGCDVVGWATNAAETLAVLESATADVAIVDIQLRDGDDGVRLASDISERYGIEIIFVTAQTDPRMVDRAKKVNPRAFVPKPYNPATILAAVCG
jgi:two-component system, LytTR family, response regulator LytT